MNAKSDAYERVRRLLGHTAETAIQPGDEAVLRSILQEATPAELYAALETFFDIEPLTLGVYEEFLARGSDWEPSVRERLTRALFFCGFDKEANEVLTTLK